MVRFLAIGLAMTILAAGCGYKGPLVMPEQEAAESESTEKTKKQKTP